MEISYAFQKTDYTIAQKLAAEHFRKQARGVPVALLLNLITWVFVGVGAMAAFHGLRNNPHWYISNMFVVVVSVLGGVAHHLGFKAYNRRMFLSAQQASLEPFPIDFHVALSELGVELNSRLGQTLLPWSCLSGVKIFPQHLAIYLRHAQVVVIPSSAFAHTDEISKFTSYIAERVGT